jgi:hypothetical protein
MLSSVITDKKSTLCDVAQFFKQSKVGIQCLERTFQWQDFRKPRKKFVYFFLGALGSRDVTAQRKKASRKCYLDKSIGADTAPRSDA